MRWTNRTAVFWPYNDMHAHLVGPEALLELPDFLHNRYDKGQRLAGPRACIDGDVFVAAEQRDGRLLHRSGSCKAEPGEHRQGRRRHTGKLVEALRPAHAAAAHADYNALRPLKWPFVFHTVFHPLFQYDGLIQPMRFELFTG